MQLVKVENAIGNVLCHDITRIVPGEFKGVAFKKGHIVKEEDVSELLKLGKERLYVWEFKDGVIHEDEAGLRIAMKVSGGGIELTEPKEGKITLIAEHDGLFMVNEELLTQINTIEEVIVSTLSNMRPVKKGNKVGGVRIIPLVISEEKLKLVESIGPDADVVKVVPFLPRKTGIITTGSEVYHGRIQDKFGPVVKEKVKAYGCEVIDHIIVPDNLEQITQAVKSLVAKGAELILTTGGMSVDPDDLTPSAIKNTGARIVTYGAPVLPGAMLMAAYLGDVPILGLPGCVMYHKTTVFDLVLARVLAGQTITRPMIVKLGMGGFCLDCEFCRYPDCAFGTGA